MPENADCQPDLSENLSIFAEMPFFLRFRVLSEIDRAPVLNTVIQDTETGMRTQSFYQDKIYLTIVSLKRNHCVPVGHYMKRPPVTSMTLPVMYELLSEAKNCTTCNRSVKIPQASLGESVK